ncbi:MAG: PAS domain-containing protein [Oligoflexus sp.]|nr:PAS domain-containing protein [Oligoflexus sp.]
MMISPPKYLTIFVFITVFLAFPGMYVAKKVFENQLNQEIQTRSDIIVNMVNFSAETMRDINDLQRLVSSLSAERDITSILVISRQPNRIVASSLHRWIGKELQAFPLDPETKAAVEQAIALRQPRFIFDHETLEVIYISPIILTQSIIRGSGTGLVSAVTVLHLDVRGAYRDSLMATLKVVWIVTLCSGIIVLSGFQMSRRRTAHIVRAIKSAVIHRSSDYGAALSTSKLPPEISELVVELKNTLDALKTSEYRLKMAFEAGGLWACEWVQDTGQMVWIHNEEFLGFSGEDWPSTYSQFVDTIYPEDRTSIWNQVQSSLTLDHGFSFEVRLELKSEVRWFAIKGKVMKQSEQNSVTMIGIDITDRKQSEKTIAAQQARLITSNKMSALGEMAGGIAHEINNPLAIIDGKSKQIRIILTRERICLDSICEPLDTISQTISRIAQIVRGLKTFSRTGEVDPFKHVFLKVIVEETLSLCLEKFKANGVDLIIDDIPSDLALKCRQTEISQVLLNLLSNAFDAVCGVEERWIKIKIQSDKLYLRLSVSNSGPVIPQAIRAKVWEPFFTTKEVGTGTGLGLSISKGITEAHGGKLELDENIESTQFTISLPVSRVA